MALVSPTQMKYVRLGKSGLKVSQIILGCMSYGSSEWQKWVLGEKEGIEHITEAYKLGINTFDTANVYSNGLSEVILGKAIKQNQWPRASIVVMTKLHGAVAREYGATLQGVDVDTIGYVNQHGQSRKHIFESVKASLERLQLDYIDLLQCHRFDYETPIEETMQALHDVVQAGYVRYIGMSSCHAYQFHAMQNYAINNKLTPFISMQNHHSAIYREEEREMMPTLELFGVGSIPWSPLARGLLCRPYAPPSEAETSPGSLRHGTDRFGKMLAGHGEQESNKAIITAIEEIAKKKNVKMAQVALAWSLSKSPVAAPIIGTTKLESLKECADAIHITLTPEEIKSIEEPYTPRKIFGHQ